MLTVWGCSYTVSLSSQSWHCWGSAKEIPMDNWFSAPLSLWVIISCTEVLAHTVNIWNYLTCTDHICHISYEDLLQVMAFSRTYVCFISFLACVAAYNMFNYLHRFSVGLQLLEMVDQSSHWQPNSCVYFCWCFVWPIFFDPSNKEKVILILFLARKNWVWCVEASILTRALSSRHIPNDEEGGSQSPSHSKRCYRGCVGLSGSLALTEEEPVGVQSGWLEIRLQVKLKKRSGEKGKRPGITI